MISLSLASNSTEARKFFRDDDARSRTPGLDVVRVRMPSLSRAWGSISIVVVNRNADVLGIITDRAEVSGVTMKKIIAQESKDIARVNEAEMRIANCRQIFRISFARRLLPGPALGHHRSPISSGCEQ